MGQKHSVLEQGGDSMAKRFLDVSLEIDLENDCPLLGLANVQLVSIDKAIRLAAAVSGLSREQETVLLHCAKRKAKRLLQNGGDPLSANEIAAINIYTQESPLYMNLNAALRQRDRTRLKPAFAYLRLLLSALLKLPAALDTVNRGVTLDLSGKYPQGAEVVWWGFSSATASVQVLQSEQFLGKTGKRTLFSIKVRAVDIRRYSAIAAEEERLILPGVQLVVKGRLDMGNGLTMVQLEEAVENPSLLVGLQGFQSGKSQPAPQHFAPPTASFSPPTVPITAARTVPVARIVSTPQAHTDANAAFKEGCKRKDEGRTGYPAAFQLFLKAANAGHAEAMGQLGKMYYNGQGCPTDYNAAALWTQKAASTGVTEIWQRSALHSLGHMHDLGRGVPMDKNKAKMIWAAVAQHGGTPGITCMNRHYGVL